MADLLTFDEACALVQRLLPAGWRVLPDGYADEVKYLVRYETGDGADWDLPVITVKRSTGHVVEMPWFLGYDLPESMEPVRTSAAP